MITSTHIGGYWRTGNQLFQCAAVVGHARKIGVDFEFPEWELSDRIFPNHVNKNIQLHDYLIYKEPRFEYDPIPDHDSLNLRGFFQSEKYFHNVKEELTAEFCKSRPSGHLPGCAIHVRRGDYLAVDYFHRLTRDNYYNKAIAMMSIIHAKEIKAHPEFHIYSDDPEFCRKEFSEKCYVVHDMTQSPLDTILEMSRYKYLIMANSSFSWWAAYLGSAVVITPGKWFQSWNYSTEDLYLPEWIKM